MTQFREFVHLDRRSRSEGLTPAEVERWTLLKRSLGKRFSPGLSDARADERHSVRVPTRLRVQFGSEGELRDQWMTNLSRGGLFVATTHLLPIGTPVTLFLEVDSVAERLEIPAEVVSHNVGPRFESDAHGMGLQFLEADDATRKAIDALYDASLQRAVHAGVAK